MKTAEELRELGKFYFLNEKYDQAIVTLKKALALDPGNAEIYYQLGLSYESKNMPESREMYRKALEIDPKLSKAQEHLDKLTGA